MTAASSRPALTASTSPDPLDPPRYRRPHRLGDTVVTYLVDRIVSGAYPVGTVLPTEPELCREFGVSRTVVRESIKLLEAKGLVKATSGRGTRVLEPIGWNLLDPLVLEAQIRHDSELSILDDLVNVRAALECDMAAQCAHVITPAQAEALTKQANVLAESLHDPERYAREDVAFHEMIMLVSGNRLGHAIIHGIHAKARLSSRYNGDPSKEELVQSLAQHRQIESMILRGDAQGAAAAMRVHIVGSWAQRRPRVHGAMDGKDEL